MEDNINALSPGYVLHWYRITSFLGQGGFGVTYRAFDKNLDKDVAIKEYLPSDLATRSGDKSITPSGKSKEKDYYVGLKRFLDEGKTLARFEHPNLVHVVAVFEANNTGYMVMSYEKGKTLADRISQNGPVPEKELIRIFEPLLKAVEAVHRKGFVHRDIKPSNVIIRDDGSPVLIDFGSARYSLGEITKTITSIVSLGYAPIEQYYRDSKDQGPWTDVYALGATMYKCVSGVTPMDAVERSQTTKKLGRSTLVPLSEFSQGKYSDELLAAIELAMVVDPGDRVQSAYDLRRALGWTNVGDAADEEDTVVNPRSVGAHLSSKYSPRKFGLVGASVLLVLGLIFFPRGEYSSLTLDVPSAATQVDQEPDGSLDLEQLWLGALKQFELGNYIEAKKLAGELSDRGDYRGQFLIGAAIWSGDAETSNKREGERLISPLIPQIRRGEKEGDHWAATMLAILYANGIGVEADLAQAKHYYERALEIEPTNVWAQALLGILLRAPDTPLHDPNLAFRWTSASALQGFSRSQLRLAWMYANAFGVPKDVPKAVEWAKKAASQGNAEAQFEVATLYEKGNGVPQNPQLAIEWHEKAAASGFAKSLLALGKAYREGRIYPIDNARAFKLVRKAAEQGLPEAEAELGSYFESGIGVEKDPQQAVEWYRRAAANGYGFAEALLGFHYQHGGGVARDLVEAEALFRSASDKGFLYGTYSLGTLLLGSNDQEIIKKGLAELTRAHEQGFLLASRALGAAYLSGLGTDKNQEKSFEILIEAADRGDVGSQSLIGDMYRDGVGVESNYDKATEYFRRAADQGDTWGTFSLGKAYVSGEGVQLDATSGFRLIEKASLAGLPQAHEALSLLYSTGTGVPTNKVEAYAWANIALAEGIEAVRSIRDDLANELTPAETEKTIKLSEELFEKYGRK